VERGAQLQGPFCILARQSKARKIREAGIFWSATSERIYANFSKWLVHRLVMHVFCGESSLGVNHKNGIKDDNRLENLEYCTQGENVRHAISIGRKAKPWDRRADKGPTAKFTWDDVRYIRSSKENSESLSRKFNVYSSTIRRIRSNKTWVVS
jgi:hypothetical protein